LIRSHTDWPGVWFGVALGWLTAFHYFKLPPALPVLLERFGYPALLAGAFMSVFALAGLLLSTWAGRRLGRFGARQLVFAALLLTLVGSGLGLLTPLCPDVMLVSRAIESMGYAILSVVGVVLAVGAAAPRDKSLAAALWATWIPVGQVMAALVSIPALEFGLWQLGWVVGMALCIPALILNRTMERQSRVMPAPAEPHSALANDQKPGQEPAPSLGYRLLPPLVFALWSGQFIAYMTWLPEYLVKQQDIRADQAAMVYLVVPVMIVAFNLLAGLLLRRGLSFTLLLVGALLVQGLLWLVLPSLENPMIGLLCLALYGAAAGTVPTCMFNLPHALGLGAAASTRAFASLMVGRNLGALAGPILLPQVHRWADDWHGVAMVFATITVSAGIVGAFMMTVGDKTDNAANEHP
jgi:MFS family permease